MYQLKSYARLLLLVSILPVAMPQIRNLSPLRGILNTDLPDSFRTATVATFASAGASAGAADGAGFGGGFASQNSAGAGPGFRGGFASQSPGPSLRGGVTPFFDIPSAPGALGNANSGSNGGGFNSFRADGGVAFSSAAAGSFEGSSGFGGGAAGGFGGGGFANNAPSPPRSLIISADDVEEALEFAFGQSSSSNRFRPQGQTPPAAASFPQSFGGGSAGSVADSDESFEEASPQGFGGAAGGAFGGSAPLFPLLEGTSLSHFGFRLTQPASERDSNCIGQPVEGASIRLSIRNGLTAADALIILPGIDLEEESCLRQRRRGNCPDRISSFLGALCNPNDPYRTLDGSCNNLRNPEWGASKRPFNRYLQPEYEDGIHEMRGEGRSIPLPSARTVSAGLQGISQKPPREDLTLLVMQWGQFLDHDLTHTPEATNNDEDNTPSPISCCEFGEPGFPSDDNCRPIDVSNDQLYREQGRQCMRFVRSLVASKGCSTGSLGPREQLNQLTSYLDASQVYGSDDEEAEGLRSGFGGLLRDSQPPSAGHGSGKFLPRHNCPEAHNNEQNCFEAGDVRVNEQPALTSMHTLWLRVHNNIARELASLNPSWDDEMLYQETRRIVAALHQQITYREFLPIVHGPDFLREFQLNLQDQGYDNSYNPNTDATIVNVFATAAFRYGHTLIAESFKGMGRNVTLRGNFDEPLVLNDPSTSPSALLQGLTSCPTRGSDAFLTPTLVNHLLSKSSDPVGFDLMALNIQRGRDHGLPPYHAWRRSCGLSNIISFDDLYSIMDQDAVNVFRATYRRVEDIDLFPAGLAENTMPGGLLGPTFSCLLAQQFQALKIGDRFWYENQNQPNPFTPGQLSAIREQSLASIMCQHLGLDRLQPMVFRSERLQGNQLQDCSAFPRLNLRSWSRNQQNHTTPYPNPTPKPPGPRPNSLCVGVGVWLQLPGMDQWCTDNCYHIGAQYCPSSHCSCTS